MSCPRLAIDRRQYLELEKLALGAFAPLRGFMGQEELASVVERMRLPTGEPFPLPVVLDLSPEQADRLAPGRGALLSLEGVDVGEVHVESVYTCDKRAVAERVLGTADERHPGAAHFLALGDVFVGGPVRLLRRVGFEFSAHERTPQETRRLFRERGWRSVAGFQTRNIPHRAHEHLLRLALEVADGLFIQPLVGWKRCGDYTPAAILAAFGALIDGFLPRQRVVLGVLSTAMRYAGPREALFHAIVRRNYGCTHFIVGRDHAGVDSYYDRYAAQELTGAFESELGIRILRFGGPLHCARCGGIVSNRTCPHAAEDPAAVTEISGSAIRARLRAGASCAPEWIRPEVLASLLHLRPFIGQEEA